MDTEKIKRSLLDHHYSVAAFLLLAATLVMFGNVLFLYPDRVISCQDTDTYSHFIYWREFGFNEMRQGNIPLWNPHLYSGMPFFGGSQSALLYPPNWLFMILPLALAFNISIVIHVFLIGFFMYLWSFSRGLHPAAGIAAAFLVMFSGANFMHIFAGNQIDICTMAWAPLILLTVDRLLERPSPAWQLIGIWAVVMQILAGHPQYLFYTAISVLLYVLFNLQRSSRPFASLASVASIYLGAVGIAAVQLLTSLETASETVRSTGVTFRFASMFSYPPENLISLVSPFFFGDIKTVPYWGRAYLWAMTLYIGVTGFILSLLGLIHGGKHVKRFAGVMVLCLVILALGKNTPLFPFLYHYVPGFNMFRGASKFIFPATLFLAILAAIGMDSLIKDPFPKKIKNTICYLLISIGAALFAAGLFLSPQFNSGHSPDMMGKLMNFIVSTGESYLPDPVYQDGSVRTKTASFAAKGMVTSAILVLALAITIALSRYSRLFLYVILALVCAEVFAFSWHIKANFPLSAARMPELNEFFRENPGDYRILNLHQPNSALSMDVKDIWGYDPGVLLRYAQFIGFTQGDDHRNVSNYILFRQNHWLLKMLRLRYIILPEDRRIKIVENRDYLPRMQLINQWEVIPEKAAILKRMGEESFDPRRKVILEKTPGLSGSEEAGNGTFRILDESTDHLTLHVQTTRDTILLITDTYSKGWRVRNLNTQDQNSYEVLPGNYTLMAIPLKEGAHKLLLEYSPLGYRIGKWVSAISLLLYIAAVIYFLLWVHRSDGSGKGHAGVSIPH